MKKIIAVSGMHCTHCAAAVEQSLAKLENVKKAKADFEKGQAVVSLKGDVPDDAIRAAVESAGFTADGIAVKKGLFD